MLPISQRFRGRSRVLAKTVVLSALAPFLWSSHVLAQAPQQNASFVPVALWVVGVVILGVAIAWGILHNRRRTWRERQITEQATRERYSEEERDRARARSRR
jgi:hypothetical protein